MASETPPKQTSAMRSSFSRKNDPRSLERHQAHSECSIERDWARYRVDAQCAGELGVRDCSGCNIGIWHKAEISKTETLPKRSRPSGRELLPPLERQPDDDGRADALDRADAHGAAVQLGERARDGQPEARALVGLGGLALALFERPAKLLPRHAGNAD